MPVRIKKRNVNELNQIKIPFLVKFIFGSDLRYSGTHLGHRRSSCSGSGSHFRSSPESAVAPAEVPTAAKAPTDLTPTAPAAGINVGT